MLQHTSILWKAFVDFLHRCGSFPPDDDDLPPLLKTTLLTTYTAAKVELKRMMEEEGFKNVQIENFAFGAVASHIGLKP